MEQFYTYVHKESGKEITTSSLYEDRLKQKGFIRKGFKDEQGVTRHTLSRARIELLYTGLENFIADCTVEEYNEYKESFTAVKTLIHQRIRETLKK